MCKRLATSREHVPPLCFFPDANELPELAGFRKNLVTVPSCDEHNSAKSGDDEYLLSVIVAHHESNTIAQRISSTKLIRSLKRRPWLAPRFFQGLFPVRLRGLVTGAFFIDRPRFDRTIDHIARGIFNHHYGRKARGLTGIVTSAMADVSSPNREQINAALAWWKTHSEKAMATLKKHGENQPVFYYQAVEGQQRTGIAIRLAFYEGLVIDVIFHEESAS